MQREYQIKDLAIENFLSLENVKIELGKLNLLVGPNASGKSNVVKALTFLNKLAYRDVSSICKELGIESVKHLIFNFSEKRQMRLKVGLKVEDEDLFYETAITSEGRIFEEIIKSKTETFLTRQRGEIEAKCLTDSEEMIDLIAGSTFLSILPSLPNKSHPLLMNARDIIRGFQAYSFDPYEIRSVSSSGFNLMLDPRGGNLAQVLHSLVTSNRKKFLEVEETMKNLISEIDEINAPTTETGDKVYLALREKKVSQPLKYANISDGTLRVLAFVTALSLESSLVAFEEPENCVHPYLFETIVDLCRKTPNQVIITTHSPYLVDKVKPQELYVVSKEEGKTVLRKVKGNEMERVKRMLKEGLTLGEVWYSGELGGIPHE